MVRMPHVPVRHKRAATGEIVGWVDDLPDRMLSDWSRGIFTPGDDQKARDWRDFLKSVDLEGIARRMRVAVDEEPSPLRDLPSAFAYVDRLMGDPERQVAWLDALIAMHNMDRAQEQATWRRWWSVPGRARLLTKFAPYAAYTARVRLTFDFALASGQVSTRSSSTADVEYLFYLPHCRVFCSGDRLHARFAPLLLDADQRYIGQADLKAEVGKILQAVDASGKPLSSFDYPPEVEGGSFVREMWKEFMGPPEAYRRLPLTDQDRAMVRGWSKDEPPPSTPRR